MIKQFIQKIRGNSLGYLILYGGIILLVVGLGILPLYSYNYNRSQAVKKIQNQIDEQKELGQIYQLIRKAAEKKEVHTLPNPAKAKLSSHDADKFQDSFRAEAAKSGMTTVSLMPDVKTIAGGSQSLLYNATITGEFANFRRLLVGLGALPYIDQIEEINIKQNSDSMEFTLKIWIALGN
jgi:Tfp pilus assembly protein PilO